MDEMNNTPNTPQNETPAAPVKYCPHCGKQLPITAVFCGECGASLNGTGAYTQPPARPIEDTSPLKTTDYLLMLLLLCVPFVSLIVYIIWAFSGNTNVNRRNLSRAFLIYSLIGIGFSFLLVLFFMIIGISTAAILEETMVYYGMVHPFF